MDISLGQRAAHADDLFLSLQGQSVLQVRRAPLRRRVGRLLDGDRVLERADAKHDRQDPSRRPHAVQSAARHGEAGAALLDTARVRAPAPDPARSEIRLPVALVDRTHRRLDRRHEHDAVHAVGLRRPDLQHDPPGHRHERRPSALDRQFLERGDHRRRGLRTDLLLLLEGTHRSVRRRGPGRDLVSHGDVRRRFRLHGDGPHLPPDRAHAGAGPLDQPGLPAAGNLSRTVRRNWSAPSGLRYDPGMWLRRESTDGLVRLTLDHGKTHALDPGLVGELHDAFARLAADDSVKCVILTGSGDRFFCNGLDVAALLSLSREELSQFYDSFIELCGEMYLFPRPLVAAINGHAIAGGLILALTADYQLLAAETR